MIKNAKYSYIDSLRGYAVLMVLFIHVYLVFCKSDPSVFLSKFLLQCRMGVMLFYMISALTLFLSMDKKINMEFNPIRNFFIRRFFRIAPLFYLLIIIHISLKDFTTINIISTFSFTNGFFPNVMMTQIVGGDWSLAVEMIFYVLLPVLFYYVKNIQNAVFLFFITLIFSIFCKYLMLKYYHSTDSQTLIEYVYYWLPAQLPVFSLGIILYFFLFKTNINKESDFKIPLGNILVLLSLYFTIVLSYSTKLFVAENIAFSFSLMLFILGMAINDTTILNNRPIQFLGKISYSFYLLHWIVLKTTVVYIDKLGLIGNVRFVISTIIAFIISSIVSYLTYFIIEQPFQKLGAKIINALESKAKN